MSHDCKHCLVHGLNFVIFLITLNDPLDIPNFNGIVLTRTYELIPFFRSKVDAANIFGVTFK